MIDWMVMLPTLIIVFGGPALGLLIFVYLALTERPKKETHKND